MVATLIGVLATLLVAGLSLLGVIVAQLARRLDRLERDNRALWAYCRRLLDLYYRHRQPGAPDPDPLPDIDPDD